MLLAREWFAKLLRSEHSSTLSERCGKECIEKRPVGPYLVEPYRGVGEKAGERRAEKKKLKRKFERSKFERRK